MYLCWSVLSSWPTLSLPEFHGWEDVEGETSEGSNSMQGFGLKHSEAF